MTMFICLSAPIQSTSMHHSLLL